MTKTTPPIPKKLPEFRITEYPEDTYQDVKVSVDPEGQIWLNQDEDQIRMSPEMAALVAVGLEEVIAS